MQLFSANGQRRAVNPMRQMRTSQSTMRGPPTEKATENTVSYMKMKNMEEGDRINAEDFLRS
jgi:hypothetical protein